ncbi:MAG: HU family DNA-binding protein [Firmicutes bacterium]|nr:HU family DNA-binding protein [Bacillota bacterium]
MNKAELIGTVAEKSGLTKKDTERVTNAIFDTIQEALGAGERVQLVGFGTFEVRNRAAREGRNPQTGEVLRIPATKVPSFKAGKVLKDKLS